jgi:hypothetical protein
MNPYLSWPNEEGMWIGVLDKIGDFPFRVMALKDDLDITEPRKTLCFVAQWLESKDSWPYMFSGNHPCKQWRKPTEDELHRANIFYRIEPEPK